MINFGYKISKDFQIDLDHADMTLSNYLMEYEPSYKTCINCGTCAATCSSGKFTDFSFRKTILMIRRGITEQLKDQVSTCMLCGKCVLACPRGVNTRRILMGLKQYFNKETK